jgi:uncharacterized protein involved in exopolysaccharide biosynthesis
MEMKEWIAIFRKYRRSFAIALALLLALGAIWQIVQPKTYAADLTLNVTRKGSQVTGAYKYDGFYRLQADERFADTVVRWLGSPRVVSDIYADALADAGALDARELSRAFKAERLSSQMIRVSYWTKDPDQARRLSRSLVKTVNAETESLNKEQKDEAWFMVMGDDPVVRDGRTTWPLSMGIALTLGLFFGFWTVLLRHYFSQE